LSVALEKVDVQTNVFRKTPSRLRHEDPALGIGLLVLQLQYKRVVVQAPDAVRPCATSDRATFVVQSRRVDHKLFLSHRPMKAPPTSDAALRMLAPVHLNLAGRGGRTRKIMVNSVCTCTIFIGKGSSTTRVGMPGRKFHVVSTRRPKLPRAAHPKPTSTVFYLAACRAERRKSVPVFSPYVGNWSWMEGSSSAEI
jgi:hypothetical protein